MADIQALSNQDADESAAESINMGYIPALPFYPDLPALWFIKLEAYFHLANIKSDLNKFHLVISNLDQQYASEVEDIIIEPPPNGKYEKLKSELIKRLVVHEELGDRTPYQFYRHLLTFAGTGVPEDFLRTIWMNRLPASIRSIIATLSKPDFGELAKIADQIHDIISTKVATPAVAPAASSGTSGNSLSAEIAALTKQMEKLAQEVERLSRPRGPGGPRGRSHSRTRHRSSSNRSQSSYRKYPECWYHHNFGDRARKCVKPCDYLTSRNVRGDRR